MTSVSTYIERGEGVPLERTSLSPYVVVSAPSTGVSNICKVKNIPLLVQNKGSVRRMTCEQIRGQTVRNELISKGMPYQLESKRHGTIVHRTVSDGF